MILFCARHAKGSRWAGHATPRTSYKRQWTWHGVKWSIFRKIKAFIRLNIPSFSIFDLDLVTKLCTLLRCTCCGIRSPAIGPGAALDFVWNYIRSPTPIHRVMWCSWLWADQAPAPAIAEWSSFFPLSRYHCFRSSSLVVEHGLQSDYYIASFQVLFGVLDACSWFCTRFGD